MIFFSYFLIATTFAVAAVMAVLFTDPEPGRHASTESRSWPLLVRGSHSDATVLETPALAEAVAHA